MFNLFIISKNDNKISTYPFILHDNDNKNKFYLINNDFHFSLNIKNSEDIDIVKSPKKLNYKQTLNKYNENNIDILFSFKLDFNHIIENYSLNYSNFIYKPYPFKKFIYKYFNNIIPNELIDIIIQYLKIKIEYSFFVREINNNSLFLSKPIIILPSYFLDTIIDED